MHVKTHQIVRFTCMVYANNTFKKSLKEEVEPCEIYI